MTAAMLALFLAAPLTDSYLDQSSSRWTRLATQIWDYAEPSLQETKSAEAIADLLQQEGFKVTRNVGGMPTAFVASAGSGSPVIGLLAEYDALPGLSQQAGEARKNPRKPDAPGHGCGHNLLGTAAVAAAVAANRQRIDEKLPGTIRLYGAPAEEILIGKTFMITGGAFKGTDVALAWHPEDKNQIPNGTRLALSATEVEFFGKTAHAAASPWLGRSALDALELLDHALALMREHIQPTARIHRVVKDGGKVANVIPDYSKLQVWLRDKNIASVDEMISRLRKAADGAALATETRAKVTVLASVRDPISNSVVGKLMQKELERVGPPRFDETDQALAKALQKEIGLPQNGLASDVIPYGPGHGGTASSDIGEVSAVVPLAELNVVTRPLGTAAHHRGQTSCAAHPIGFKGMLVAAKVLGASAIDLLQDPKLVAEAKQEFTKATQGRQTVAPFLRAAHRMAAVSDLRLRTAARRREEPPADPQAAEVEAALPGAATRAAAEAALQAAPAAAEAALQAAATRAGPVAAAQWAVAERTQPEAALRARSQVLPRSLPATTSSLPSAVTPSTATRAARECSSSVLCRPPEADFSRACW